LRTDEELFKPPVSAKVNVIGLKSRYKHCMKKVLVFLIFTSVLSFGDAFADRCVGETEGVQAKPQNGDMVSIKSAADYNNPNYKGTNRDAMLTGEDREISCQTVTKDKAVKCFKRVELVGTATEGASLHIPEGTLLKVGVEDHKDDVHLRAVKTPGLRAPFLNMFRFRCFVYLKPLSGGHARSHKSTPCFDDDISMLFVNNTLARCSEGPALSPHVESTNSRPYRGGGVN